MEDEQQARKVQHEPSPEIEERITSMAKKALKYYLIYILLSFTIFVGIVVSVYFFVVKPTIEKQEQEIRQAREEFERRSEESQAEFESSLEESRERFEELEEEIRGN